MSKLYILTFSLLPPTIGAIVAETLVKLGLIDIIVSAIAAAMAIFQQLIPL